VAELFEARNVRKVIRPLGLELRGAAAKGERLIEGFTPSAFHAPGLTRSSSSDT
jgi:hypothetical protein